MESDTHPCRGAHAYHMHTYIELLACMHTCTRALLHAHTDTHTGTQLQAYVCCTVVLSLCAWPESRHSGQVCGSCCTHNSRDTQSGGKLAAGTPLTRQVCAKWTLFPVYLEERSEPEGYSTASWKVLFSPSPHAQVRQTHQESHRST